MKSYNLIVVLTTNYRCWFMINKCASTINAKGIIFYDDISLYNTCTGV